ncbi:GlxA family transcriptional regulator [Actinoplanes teichomyceticus]|uniref:AdpA5 n=1 Tax=Actinoplanes teichomyceticus TaxID=1867 RepID=Q6ZZK7_ACTTI|nr:helix-turn-helix domain-containing protein [Actinoplanes teichomyceticus]AKR67209.1 AdpA5 [Actinoplanes teichomyceticus]TWG11282.1 AraC family transcriptional regulator with amidase-like domain [Actinoplanes teichomyceticus]CAE53339.1 putative AraC-family transcription regulator [Actinoplanes teichomyceticus]CAG14998.1 transcriptional regulator [Actinoplanes teichomyceticus]GIF16313.1 AraC family transcriptional regulator [Actinoplanes teichomyceticus]
MVPRRVALIVDEHSNPFEVGCACEIFGGRRRPQIGYELYELTVVSPTRSVPMRDRLFRVSAPGRLSDLDRADMIIVPNRPDVDVPSRGAVLAAIRRAHARGARLVGLCTGAFTLAEAGVLDGRRAAVHWQLAPDFHRRFPAVRLEPDVLFVDDGDILTSAGSAAALDLGLHIVRRDHGTEVANRVGRQLVFAAFRDGGQRQFVERPLPAPATSPLAPVLQWAQERLHLRLSVDDLARHGRMSTATLHRRFRNEVGSTPLAWLTAQRVALACRLIEQGAAGVDAVARQSGLGTAANLRALLRKHVGLSPSEYRRRFAADGAR